MNETIHRARTIRTRDRSGQSSPLSRTRPVVSLTNYAFGFSRETIIARALRHRYIYVRIIVNGFARPAGERCRLINLNAYTYPKRIRSYLRYCPPLRRRDTVADAQRPQMSRGGGLKSQIFYPLIRVVYGCFFCFKQLNHYNSTIIDWNEKPAKFQ